jgi:hypothetical protein
MESKRIDLKNMREQIARRKTSAETKRKLFIENLSREKFCEILDRLPSMFRFGLTNIREDFDGYWEKTIVDGKTAWQKDDRVLLSQFLFPFKKEVCDAIDREIDVYYKAKRNWQVIRKILFNDETIQIITKRKGEITISLTKETLNKLYFKQNKSLEDIAKEYGTSRQNVMKIMKRYGLVRRPRSRARYLAMDAGKFPKLMQYEINEKVFSIWSPQMAWALGLLLTDGHIHGNNVKLASVDIDLLEKVKNILNLSKPIITSKQSYDKSKLIYYLAFSSKRMREDLNKLGLIEKKSLILVFPDVPEKYIRHFIRGCWDGDGSVYISKGKINANFYSGSKAFIIRLVEELYKNGIFKKGLSYRTEKSGKRVFLPVTLPVTDETITNYSDGRFPLRIHMKNVNAYYIKLDSKENLKKLFHYFYDGVDESIYLSRKYEVFIKGLKLDGKGEKEQLTLNLDF